MFNKTFFPFFCVFACINMFSSPTSRRDVYKRQDTEWECTTNNYEKESVSLLKQKDQSISSKTTSLRCWYMLMWGTKWATFSKNSFQHYLRQNVSELHHQLLCFSTLNVKLPQKNFFVASSLAEKWRFVISLEQYSHNRRLVKFLGSTFTFWSFLMKIYPLTTVNGM